jgi:hypothetical protein
VAGTTYYVMVGECCSNGGVGGGPLVLHVRTAPKVTVRNSDSGTVSKLSGDARVGGMIQCDRTLTGFMFAVLSQRVGESSLARGFGGGRGGGRVPVQHRPFALEHGHLR